MKPYHIFISLGIGALVTYIIANICGLIEASTDEGIYIILTFVISLLIYMLLYLRNMKKTFIEENNKMRDCIESLKKTLEEQSD